MACSTETAAAFFESTDGGKTWRQLTKGLPGNIVQANIAIAPSAPKTLFAAVRTKTITKLYRSDDAGETVRRLADHVNQLIVAVGQASSGEPGDGGADDPHRR